MSCDTIDADLRSALACLTDAGLHAEICHTGGSCQAVRIPVTGTTEHVLVSSETADTFEVGLYGEEHSDPLGNSYREGVSLAELAAAVQAHVLACDCGAMAGAGYPCPSCGEATW